jgi:hypothetical protein
VNDSETLRVAVPVFLSVKTCVGVDPVATLPKLNPLGVHEIAGAAAVCPVPVNVALPDTPFVTSFWTMVAEYAVAAVGLNWTVAVHDALAASVAAQVVLGIVNAELPLIDSDTFMVAVPLFCKVKINVGVAPIFTVPKAWVVGLQVTAGAVVEVAPTNVVTL